MVTIEQMNATQLIMYLSWVEMDTAWPADMRQALSQERMALMSAIQRQNQVGTVLHEAKRVTQMWLSHGERS